MEIVLGMILLVLAHLLMSLTLFILNVGPIIVIIIYIFSLLGIIIFIIAESFKDKYLNKVLQKIFPDKINVHNNINRVINTVLLLMKIPFSIFNYILFIGLLILVYQYNYYQFVFFINGVYTVITFCYII
jgi:hypothetical protein